MKMAATEPQVNPEGWYTGIETMKHLGLPKTSFYRCVREGRIKFRVREVDVVRVFQGREILRFWRASI